MNMHRVALGFFVAALVLSAAGCNRQLPPVAGMYVHHGDNDDGTISFETATHATIDVLNYAYTQSGDQLVLKSDDPKYPGRHEQITMTLLDNGNTLRCDSWIDMRTGKPANNFDSKNYCDGGMLYTKKVKTD